MTLKDMLYSNHEINEKLLCEEADSIQRNFEDYCEIVDADEAADIFGGTPEDMQQYLDEVSGYVGVPMKGIVVVKPDFEDSGELEGSCYGEDGNIYFQYGSPDTRVTTVDWQSALGLDDSDYVDDPEFEDYDADDVAEDDTEDLDEYFEDVDSDGIAEKFEEEFEADDIVEEIDPEQATEEFNDEDDIDFRMVEDAENDAEFVIDDNLTLHSADMELIDEIANEYCTSNPTSDDWNTELESERNEIADTLNIPYATANLILIKYLGFPEDEVSALAIDGEIEPE